MLFSDLDIFVDIYYSNMNKNLEFSIFLGKLIWNDIAFFNGSFNGQLIKVEVGHPN